MNTKTRLLFLALAAILLLGAAQMLSAGVTVSVTGSTSIAPSSIPVPESGTVIIGMNRVTLFGGGNGSTSMASMDVQLISSPTFNAADIQSIRVYWEPSGGNGLYDNGAVFDDVNALSGGPYTFSSGLATIPLNSLLCTMTDGQTARLYVAVELKSTAVYSGDTIGVQTISVTQSGKGPMSVTGHGVQKPLDKYRVTPTVTGDAPIDGTTYQGESASMIKLFFDPVDNDASAKIRLATVKVHQVGSPWIGGDSNLNSGGVVLYEDTNANGSWDNGPAMFDSQVTSATLGSPTPAYATLTLSTPAAIPASGKTFFVVVNIALLATEFDEVELQIDNPSTDITFSDAYADDLVGADYAYIPAGAPYLQKGYLTGTSSVPVGSNATVVQFQSTPPKPIVSSIDPGNSAANVLREAAIHATFSKNMLGASINTDTFKLFNGAVEVPGSVTFDGTVNATFTPTSLLDWGTTFTVRIYGGATGVEATVAPTDMESDKVWSFTTEYAVYPTVLSTSPMNAQIEVPRATTVTATFSKDINPASIISPAITFRVYDGTSYVSGTVTYDAPSRTATFTQTTPPLVFGTIYTATVSTDATDTDGLALQSAHVWTFTTTAPVYPLVAVTTPTGGQSEVPRTDNLTATFSKDMNEASVLANFKLYDSTLTLVAATVTWDAPSWTATLNPTPTLNWGEVYTAKVLAAATSADGLQMLSDKVWTFTSTAPVYPIVTLTAPANGDNEIPRTTTVAATFSKSMNAATLDFPGVSTFQVFKDNNSNSLYDAGTDTLISPTSVTYVEGTKTVTFTSSTTLVWGTTYTARISTAATATDGLAVQSAKVWTFTTTQPIYPTVTVTDPSGGDTEVSRTTTVRATFSKSMTAATLDFPGVTTFQVFKDNDSNSLYDAGTDTLITPTSVAYDEGTKRVTFTPNATLVWGTTYTARISTAATATDGLAMQSAKVWTFTTTQPIYPTVTVTDPSGGDTEVSRTTTVRATYSKSMNAATLDFPGVSTFQVFEDNNTNSIYDAGDTLITPTSVAYDEGTKRVTFTPNTTLAWGTTYTARISTAATATDGLAMQSAKVWTFTTTQPVWPTVLSTSPVDGANSVARTATISVVFSKDMDGTTITASTFVVKKGLAIVPEASVVYTAGTRTATFTPAASMDWGTTYNVTIVSGALGVKAADQLPMLADKTWTFTTVVAANPVVVNTSPSPNAVSVLPGDNIAATFSKTMTASTLVSPATNFQVYIDADEDGIYDVGETLVAGTVTYAGASKTATFNPTTDLAPGQKYTALITTSAQDTDLLPMLADHTWVFWVSSRPAVMLASPASGAVGVSRSTTIKAVFSKDMKPSTLDDTTFLVEENGGGTITGIITYNATNFTATFTPDVELDFATFDVTVKGTVTDTNDIPLSADYTWSFSTMPSLSEPVAANNRISPSSTDPVTIFVPQPPQGAADRVTVQVFTATGKKVATLVNNVAWSTFQASLPIEWNGRNDLGEPLGPGLYFIQIRATGYLRTLKVMIVR